MTEWTDERLEALLTASLAAHEVDADPAVARRIALTPAATSRRPRLMIGAAAVAAVVAVVGIAVQGHHHTTPGPVEVTSPTAVPPGHNRALAVAEAGRLLAAVPVPPGSTRSATAPDPALRRLRLTNGPVDPSLTRTRWWVVPLSYRQVVSWYDAHSPASISSVEDPSGSGVVTPGDLYWPVRAADPAAYSAPTVVVSYARLGRHATALRTDVMIAARADRTAETLVPPEVQSVEVSRSSLSGPSRRRETGATSDPALVAKVASAYNGLRGAPAHTMSMPCGSPVGGMHVYAVTFHWPGHTLAVDPGATLCGIGRGLTLDGTELPQRLQDSSALDDDLQAVLDAS